MISLKKPTRKFWITLTAEILFVVAIFMAVSYWHESDMLSPESAAPELTAMGLDGKMYRFPDTENKTDRTLVYFFAPWCKICHLSISNLKILRGQISEQKLTILIVALDWKSKTEIENYMDEHELAFPVLLGDQRWQQEYKIKGFPSYYVLDKKGSIISKSMGYSTSIGMIARSILD